MYRPCVLAALGLWLAPALAVANPIAMEVIRARQVPGSRHVQLTYATDQSLGNLPDPQAPVKATRDDVELNLSWQLLAGSFTANTGSGLTSTISRKVSRPNASTKTSARSPLPVL